MVYFFFVRTRSVSQRDETSRDDDTLQYVGCVASAAAVRRRHCYCRYTIVA